MRDLLIQSHSTENGGGSVRWKEEDSTTITKSSFTDDSSSLTSLADASHHPIIEVKQDSFRLSFSNNNNAPSYRTITNWMSGTQLDTSDLPENAAEDALSSLRIYNSVPLDRSDVCMAMQTWNKVLAFRSSFSEALVLQWRLLLAAAANNNNDGTKAYRQVEKNQDLLARLLGERLREAETLVMGLLDAAIRSYCPRDQTVLREAYRPICDDILIERVRNDDPGEIFHTECETVADTTKLFARLGIPPHAWVAFTRACAWALATHVPYAQDDDRADITAGVESAILRAIVQKAAIPCIQAWQGLADLANDPSVSIILPRFWEKFDKKQRDKMGEAIYRNLFTEHPSLTDYFAKTDMDFLSIHLMKSLKVIVRSAVDLSAGSGPFRSLMKHLGDVHLTLGVPSYTYPLLGKSIIDTLLPYMEEEEKITANSSYPAKASELKAVFIRLYSEVMSLVYYPMIAYEKTLKIAKEFYEKVAVELNWNNFQLETRMIQIEQELGATGTYTQTSQEIEIGARLAWRNSSKCIGRISWNTLKVIDRRHVTDPEGIFREVEAHMKIATAGTNIQSTMTVFRPQHPNESIGPRFWTDQVVRYACYRDEKVRELIGVLESFLTCHRLAI